MQTFQLPSISYEGSDENEDVKRNIPLKHPQKYENDHAWLHEEISKKQDVLLPNDKHGIPLYIVDQPTSL